MSAATAALSHVYPLGSRVNAAGHLEIGGCDVVAVAERFGTPAYLVAEDDLRARARAFRAAMAARHDDFDVLFASKAFPCTAVYRLMAEAGLGCDVASGGELAMALRAGFEPNRIYLHGNANSRRELQEALDAGIGHVVLDSFDELDLLESIAHERGDRQHVLLRITPDVSGETHASMSTGQADTKFGFSIADAEAAIARVERAEHLGLVGLHFHIGSQLQSLAPFRTALAAIARLKRFPLYNLGGGLGVAYLQAQRPPGIEEYVEALIGGAHELLGTDNRLVIEPGRALVANAAVTVYRVQTVKHNVSTWVAVDGGMSDNLRPMLYGSRYEAIVGNRALDQATDRCHIAGKHCESGDVIVRDAHLASPKVGDVIVTPATGAYGYALANNYNCVARPPVIFCRDGEAREVVRRETYEDLMSRDV